MLDAKRMVAIAEDFLCKNDIAFVPPGKVHLDSEGNALVTFFVPEYFDKAVAVADPPDVRVKIDVKSETADLEPQM